MKLSVFILHAKVSLNNNGSGGVKTDLVRSSFEMTEKEHHLSNNSLNNLLENLILDLKLR